MKQFYESEHTGLGLPGRVGRILNRKVLNRWGIQIVHPTVVHGPSSQIGVAEWSRRLWINSGIMAHAKDVPGDFIECGVYWGHGVLIMLQVLQIWGQANRKIVGFDSFAGHPKAVGADLSTQKAEQLGDAFATTEADVWKTLELGTSLLTTDLRKQVTLVPGWFSDTMPKYNGQIAFMHLDPDYYTSTKDTLINLWPRLAVGGVVQFGAMENSSLPGKGAAVREFIGQADVHAELRRFQNTDNHFLVRTA